MPHNQVNINEVQQYHSLIYTGDPNKISIFEVCHYFLCPEVPSKPKNDIIIFGTARLSVPGTSALFVCFVFMYSFTFVNLSCEFTCLVIHLTCSFQPYSNGCCVTVPNSTAHSLQHIPAQDRTMFTQLYTYSPRDSTVNLHMCMCTVLDRQRIGCGTVASYLFSI